MTAPGEDRAVAAGDGGVRSCRKIPPGWSEKRFKYLAQTVKGHIPPSTKGDSPDTRTAPYLSMEYLRGEIEKPVFMKADQDSLYAEDGDVLLLWDGANAGEFSIAKAGIVSSTVAKIMPIGVDDRFLFWMCKGREDFVRSETVGMGIPHVNGHSLANMRVPLPPLPQQRAIADRLDRETGRLDALVAAKRRLLELLAEKRRALIAHAVTRGLAPEAPMKPTGMEWMQEVPDHWETRRLKACVTNVVSMTDRREPGDLYIALEHVESWTGKIVNMDSGTTFESQAKRFRPDDVLFGKLRPYLAKSTRPGQAGVCAGEFLVLRPKNDGLLPGYLEAFFRSKPVVDAIDASTFGAKMPRADWQFIGNMNFPLPPICEQRAIADYLDRETGRLDALAGRTRESVALLRERRAALISAAVGGR